MTSIQRLIIAAVALHGGGRHGTFSSLSFAGVVRMASNTKEDIEPSVVQALLVPSRDVEPIGTSLWRVRRWWWWELFRTTRCRSCDQPVPIEGLTRVDGDRCAGCTRRYAEMWREALERETQRG